MYVRFDTECGVCECTDGGGGKSEASKELRTAGSNGSTVGHRVSNVQHVKQANATAFTSNSTR